MMKNAGIDTALLTEESVRFDITPLLTGMVDVWPGYAINQPITAEEKGFPVNLIWPSDYGVELYADTLFTTEDMIKNNPDLVKRFVSATMQGWNYAYNNVDEVVGYTLMYSDVLTKQHETSMMKASLQSLKPTDRPIGPMDRDRWEGMQKLLLDNEFMDNPIDLDKAFTNEFLPTAKAAGVTKVALVTDALLSDQGWGTAAYNAITAVQAKYGFELGTAEGVAVPDIESTLRDFAEQGYDLIIAHGFQWSDPALAVGKDYPNTKFVVFTGFTSGPGVASIFPLQQEGTFPLGALAAMMSKTGVVGFVGGEPYPNLINIVEGYKAGAMYINPDVKVIISWTGDWDDPAKGREAANAQIAQGADVLFHTADTAGHGMIRAAQDKGLYAFGAVLDQWELAPDTVLSSFVLDIEKSFDMAYTMTNEGMFREEMIKPGIETGPGGPGDGIVYVAPFHELTGDVPQDVKNRLGAIITDIQNGRLVIPETYEFTAEGESSLTVAVAEVEPPVAEVEPPVAEVEPPVAEVEPPVAEVEEPEAEVGGCLIATAAFGSEMAPQVQLLREIRDNTVLQTESGSAFMTGFNQFYYSFSPAIADYERENPAFKEAVKLTLTPLLTSLTLLQYLSFPKLLVLNQMPPL